MKKMNISTVGKVTWCSTTSTPPSISGIFFVHFFAGSLRPEACGALSFQGKKLSFESKNISFFHTGSFFCNFLVKKNLYKVEFWDLFLGPHFLSFFSWLSFFESVQKKPVIGSFVTRFLDGNIYFALMNSMT